MILNVIDCEDGKFFKVEVFVDSMLDVGEFSKYLIVKDICVLVNGIVMKFDFYVGKFFKEFNGMFICFFEGKLVESEVIGIIMCVEFFFDVGNEC